MKLTDLLLLFLRPAIDDPAPDPQPDPASPAADPAPDPADDLDVDPEAGSPEPAAAPSAEEFAAIAAQAKADKEARERAERELQEYRGRAPQPSLDEETRRENERLADPKLSDLERWQIQSNRTLREGRNTAQMALIQAQDVSDKASFSMLATTKPAVFKMYHERVEKELQGMRLRGYNESRESILKRLIGDDALNGKLKRKAAPAPAAGGEPAKPNVRGGKTPGARSDVTGKVSMTEHQKRIQRLENQQI